MTNEEIKNDLRYLKLLSRDFPNTDSVATEIINLEAILHLPKPTEHFLADLHGESEAFEHVLRNASGNIKRKVREALGNDISSEDLRDICTLIYYPEEQLRAVRNRGVRMPDYYQQRLEWLVKICRRVSSKYTRSKVRKSLPEQYAYIIEELLHEHQADIDKQAYVNIIIQTMIGTRRAEKFIIAMCYLIQRLSIDRLHILGDIFDRGPGAHLIMDRLENYGRWDIQWGNHDILWMGAAAGNPCCVMSVIRLSLRYANTATLEDGYGISLMPLAAFAMDAYAHDNCKLFEPRLDGGAEVPTKKNLRLLAQMHKAAVIIQFKLEGALYEKHPEWNMSDRNLLKCVDFQKGTITIGNEHYQLLDTNFPTIDPENPLKLSAEEEDVVRSLVRSFQISDRLTRHTTCLTDHGSMYRIYNDNLLFHASIPMCEDGTLKTVDILGESVAGAELMDRIELIVRTALDETSSKLNVEECVDYMWYLWCGQDSPLFGKSKMATFERQFLAEKETWQEEKGWYYKLRDEASVMDGLMDAFGIAGSHRHIINGHVPVRASRGEKPIKAEGRLIVIDGGFSKAYHDTTGIAGYTLVYHSRGLELVQHEPFLSKHDAIEYGTDIRSTTQIVELRGHRLMVSDTDRGKELREQVIDLEKLLRAYRRGYIKS